jgi:hypothetical protein
MPWSGVHPSDSQGPPDDRSDEADGGRKFLANLSHQVAMSLEVCGTADGVFDTRRGLITPRRCAIDHIRVNKRRLPTNGGWAAFPDRRIFTARSLVIEQYCHRIAVAQALLPAGAAARHCR